jgi:hypothetical protein
MVLVTPFSPLFPSCWDLVAHHVGGSVPRRKCDTWTTHLVQVSHFLLCLGFQLFNQSAEPLASTKSATLLGAR